MRYLYLIILFILTIACTEINSNPSANLIHSLERKSDSEPINTVDSSFLPAIGNGIKHILPQKDFINDYPLFQEMLQEFIYVDLPYELDELLVDRTNEEWKSQPVLNEKFYPYLIDGKDFLTIKNIVNPREAFKDFYKVIPIAKLGEKDFYNTIIYVIRYLDGNGQQDFFYLTTFNSEGTFLSSIEIGALEASAATYIKTAKISTDNIIEVNHSNFNTATNDWQKTSKSQYFLDNTGQFYSQFEDIPIKMLESKEGIETASFAKLADFKNYFKLFQNEIRKNSPNEIAKYITFPHFRVSYEEHYQDIQSKEQFLVEYQTIFNESLRKKIVRQNFNDLIFNENEISLSDGSMWFKRIGRDHDGRLVVSITVN